MHTDTKDKAMTGQELSEEALAEFIASWLPDAFAGRGSGEKATQHSIMGWPNPFGEDERLGFRKLARAIIDRLTAPPAPQAEGEIERVRHAIKAVWYEKIDLDSDLLAKAAIAALRSVQASAEMLICGACGEPWRYGLTCGQKDNGHAFPTCYPAPTVFKQQAPARTYANEWQPIETAPACQKIGEEEYLQVWVYGGRFQEPTLDEADGDWWRRMQKDGSTTVPTHWMPATKPSPPRALATKPAGKEP